MVPSDPSNPPDRTRRSSLNEKKEKLALLRAKRGESPLQFVTGGSDTVEKSCQTENVSGGSPTRSSSSMTAAAGSMLTSSPSARRRTRSSSTRGLPPGQMHLTPNQQEEVYVRTDFRDFLDRSSKIMEKAMNKKSYQHSLGDILHDYSADDAESMYAAEDVKNSALSLSGIRVHASVKGRPMLSIRCSRPELYVCAYGTRHVPTTTTTSSSSSSTSVDESQGVVCVWSELLPTRPEFEFHSSSPVLCADFHALHPHLLVGTCQSGPLLIWDMRTRGKGAVKRSNPSADGAHTHPVHSLCSTGSTESSHALLTADSAGGVCVWRNSSERISSPAASWTMVAPLLSAAAATSSAPVASHGHFIPRTTTAGPAASSSSSSSIYGFAGSGANGGDRDDGIGGGTDGVGGVMQQAGAEQPLSITCMSVACASHNTSTRSAYMGSPHGQLCRARIPIKDNDTFTWSQAHSALISAVHCHPSSQRAYRDLVLTASFDWSVRLWAVGASEDDGTSSSSSTLPSKAIAEFQSTDCDYFCDVKWSPSNPGVFACAGSGGTVSIWDLSKSVLEPADSCNVIVVASSTASSSIDGGGPEVAATVSGNGGGGSKKKQQQQQISLNRLEWAPDGSKLLCGDSDGTLYMVTVRKELAAPLSDEASGRVESNLTAWRNRLVTEEAAEAERMRADRDDAFDDELDMIGGSFDADDGEF